MSNQSTPDESAADTVSLTDPESLRDRDDVPFYEDQDVVDEETYETVSNLDDLAPVGVTNDAGDVLVMRVTEQCDRKIPSAGVEPGEDYAAAARRWVAEQAGIEIELDAIEAVWRFEARLDGETSGAFRHFVVFSGSPVDGSSDGDGNGGLPEDREAVEAGWFDELPDEAALVPGTDLFFD